jgi:hypothetical protein
VQELLFTFGPHLFEPLIPLERAAQPTTDLELYLQATATARAGRMKAGDVRGSKRERCSAEWCNSGPRLLFTAHAAPSISSNR